MKIQGVANGIEADVARPVAVIPKKDDGKAGTAEVKAAPGAAPAAAAASAPAQPIERAQGADRLAEEVQRYLKENRSKLDISLDKDLNLFVTKLLEEDTGEVIRQYPPESIIEVMKYLRSQRGTLVNEKG